MDPCNKELILGNIRIYLQVMLFLNAEMVLVQMYSRMED